MNIRNMTKSGAAVLGCAALIFGISASSGLSETTDQVVNKETTTVSAKVALDSQIKEAKAIKAETAAFLKSISGSQNADDALAIATKQWSKKLNQSARIKTYILADHMTTLDTDNIVGVGTSPILP
jgi:hypothetical protein